MRARCTGVLVAAVLGAVLATVAGMHPAGAEAGRRYVDPIFPAVTVAKDITYGQAVSSKGQLEQLKLDLYTPTGDTAGGRGLLVWAHGSGFRYGDKSDIGPLKEYVTRGWVAVSIEYRMRPELPANAFVGIVTNPTSVTDAKAAALDAQHDMQAAVRWARGHAASLGVDPGRIAAGGMSAGAIMALMVAFNPGDAGTSGSPGPSSAVAAAISHAGAYVPYLQGAVPAPGAPPIAIYHGTNDEQVPFPTSPPSCVLTILMGNTCEYVTYVGREHATLGTDLALDFLYRKVIVGDGQPRAFATGSTKDDTAAVLVGAELPLVSDLGATTGVVVPTDPAVLQEHTLGLVGYVLEALGLPPLPARLPGWG
jgi:acetyl esterase/lipase